MFFVLNAFQVDPNYQGKGAIDVEVQQICHNTLMDT